MNKSQKKIEAWLLERPGYLKKSCEEAFNSCPDSVADWKEEDTFAKVFEEVRLLYNRELKTKKSSKKPPLKPKKAFNDGKKQLSSKLRTAPGTYFITGCTHAPWQNKPMFASVFNYLKKEVELEGLILAGDIVDVNSLSSHDKGRVPIPGVTLDWEYREANKFMDQFDELKIRGTKDYIYGNHEDRYARLMKNGDESKYGDALKSPEEGLRLIERGYNVYKNWKDDCIELGPNLDVCHGEFLNIHSAKKTIDTYRKSTLYFHTHRFQVYIEGLVGGWNMGFGGDINAPIFGFATRAMKNSWVNSCCLVHLDKDGFYYVQPLMWFNNKLVVNGKVY